MNDEKIVELYWQRDERAIEKTDEKYGSYCFTIAQKILDDRMDSEECVNDTWIHTWNGIPPAKPQVLKFFVAKITRNLSLDYYRKKIAKKRGAGALEIALEELSECVSGTDDVEETVIQKELSQSIQSFLYRLPERERNVFIRRYFFVESMEEIGERYGLKEKHVPVILSRTRKKLKEHLQKEGYEI